MREFVTKRIQEGCRQVVVDLRGCESMDSTFLGVFAGMGLSLSGIGLLTLFGLNRNNRRAVDDLGFGHIASVSTVEPETVVSTLPDENEFRVLAGSSPERRDRQSDLMDRALLMLEAHESLCRLSDENESKFREVKQFLRQDIARQSPPETPER